MTSFDTVALLNALSVDCLLVNCTNKYLSEYPELSENARYDLTGFSGSTGDALIKRDKIYLFVDGRYHTQAEMEAKDGITVVKLTLNQKQDDEILKRVNSNEVMGVVAHKVSQRRLEKFEGIIIKLLDEDPINNFTAEHTKESEIAFEPIEYNCAPTFIADLEEVSYLTGLRDFTKDYSSKIWAKLFIDNDKRILFYDDKECDRFLSEYEGEIFVDKSKINAHDYNLIKHPVHRGSNVSFMKSVKSDVELDCYKSAFERTDKTVMAIRQYIEENDGLSEYDIAAKLRDEFFKNGAKCLSFTPIVAINQNSALPHYSKSSKDVVLNEGDLVLIDCGAYYESGLATDITRVFVKGKPNELQKEVYTTVLKTFLNCFMNFNDIDVTGYEIDSHAHELLDEAIDGFSFGHGLGHGIGINVHEIPPNLSQREVAHVNIYDGMCFTIEPGLYNPDFFGVRLENSCYRKNGKTHSFVKMGYEGKLIDYTMLSEQELLWLKEFKIL